LKRNVATFSLDTSRYKEIKSKMLNWAHLFSIFLFLDSNEYDLPHSKYECLLAVGSLSTLDLSSEKDALSALQQFHDANKDWLFGNICYDLKNKLESKLSSRHPEKMKFPAIQFFQPQIVCYIEKNKQALTIEAIGQDPNAIFDSINNSSSIIDNGLPHLQFEQRINKQDYIATISKLREHIADGDCYEINFCNEGYCEDVIVEPIQIFNAINNLSPAPFAAYYHTDGKYMMCSSPERYLQKTGNRILSQPIKGTARRDKDVAKDDNIKKDLQNDIKERAENVMIVDLTRNDLARSCDIGSVQVEELFGIYTFPQVHQMISTITGMLRKDIPFTDAIRYSFPMGSMTGAPKIKVMQLIDAYESSMRELFSGTVGYISPGGDFDFNVIIRSLFYNTQTKYLSYQTGGAITYDSVPEKEWEEMRLKAWALERIFSAV